MALYSVYCPHCTCRYNRQQHFQETEMLLPCTYNGASKEIFLLSQRAKWQQGTEGASRGIGEEKQHTHTHNTATSGLEINALSCLLFMESATEHRCCFTGNFIFLHLIPIITGWFPVPCVSVTETGDEVEQNGSKGYQQQDWCQNSQIRPY